MCPATVSVRSSNSGDNGSNAFNRPSSLYGSSLAPKRHRNMDQQRVRYASLLQTARLCMIQLRQRASFSNASEGARKLWSGAKMCLLATVLTMLCCNRPSSSAEPSFDQLKREFVAPPDGSKPQVWWHWMNGYITKEGIKLDLEWMSRIGLGGAQAFDAAVDTPTVVGHRLEFMTPGWRDAFRYAATLAEDLHLELAISATPGWSESGGPWVKPEEGMMM